MADPPAASTRAGGQHSRRSVLFVAGALLAAGFIAAAAAASLQSIMPQPPTHASARRRLDLTLLGTILGSEECTTEYDTLSFVPLYFALILYTFLGLAIVCDEYFCESLEQISSALSLSDDVAGATFMAAGSSAPELFTAIITVFLAPGEQGVGTIVGSAVFNICVIVGLTSLCAGQVLQLWWYPLMRDSAVYAASILLMLWAMSDGQVTAVEAGTLVSCYVLYVAIMLANGRIVELLTQRERRRALEKHEDLSPNPFGKFVGLNPTMQPAFKVAHNHKTQVRRKVQREQVQQMLMTAITVNRVRSKLVSRLSSRSTFKPEDEGVGGGSDEACSDKVMDVISWPMAKAMALTIPDCRDEGCQARFKRAARPVTRSQPSMHARRRHVASRSMCAHQPKRRCSCTPLRSQKFYFLTFTMSIMWIGVLSFVMVDFAGRAGCILGVPEFLMGLTVLAAGTSVPDALSSVLVARNGQGNMAVCNVLGSNVFNILLGLGLPWLIASLSAGEPYLTGSASILEPMVILFGYLIAFILVLALFGWRLTPSFGWLLLVMQLFYWAYNVAKVYYFVPMGWASAAR